MKDLGTVRLETKRLILRPFAAADARAMYQNWASDPEVTRYLTWPVHRDEQASADYIRSMDYADPSFYDWAIVYKELGEPVGSIGVVSRKKEAESVHIGYCIGRKWWGRGITTEALGAVIRFFFEEAGALRVDSRHDPRNAASGRVMEKCGMAYEGTARKADRNNQGICDAAWRAILKEDYERRREGR